MTFLTGASGFIGGHLARVLIKSGRSVRALLRPTSNREGVSGLDLERVVGDLRDVNSLKGKMRGCQELFHVAADYRLWARDPAEIYTSNMEGTRNILQIALEEGVERVVYTSTVGCKGMPANNEEGDENIAVSVTKDA